MSLLRLMAPSGIEHEVTVTFDDETREWSFRGLGFDFLAHPTSNGEDIDTSAFDGWQAEVSRHGDDEYVLTVWFSCPTSGLLSDDLFASKCLKELSQYWDLFGELEEG